MLMADHCSRLPMRGSSGPPTNSFGLPFEFLDPIPRSHNIYESYPVIGVLGNQGVWGRLRPNIREGCNSGMA